MNTDKSATKSKKAQISQETHITYLAQFYYTKSKVIFTQQFYKDMKRKKKNIIEILKVSFDVKDDQPHGRLQSAVGECEMCLGALHTATQGWSKLVFSATH